MIHRDRIDIISQILEAANGGINKSRIMYKALLSSAQMKEILTALTEKDLLCYDENTRILRTTEKGLRFLDIYNRISDMVKVEQPQPRQQMWIHREEQAA
jgi:predicted transcriptional regulator